MKVNRYIRSQNALIIIQEYYLHFYIKLIDKIMPLFNLFWKLNYVQNLEIKFWSLKQIGFIEPH